MKRPPCQSFFTFYNFFITILIHIFYDSFTYSRKYFIFSFYTGVKLSFSFTQGLNKRTRQTAGGPDSLLKRDQKYHQVTLRMTRLQLIKSTNIILLYTLIKKHARRFFYRNQNLIKLYLGIVIGINYNTFLFGHFYVNWPSVENYLIFFIRIFFYSGL